MSGIKMQIKTTIDIPDMGRRIQKGYKMAMEDGLLDLAEYLQNNSPRGVSPIEESLKGRWEVKPPRKVRSKLYARGYVYNTAVASMQRILGRGPGKFPPFGRGTPLAKWADSKGIPPFLVARSIAKKGTVAWRTKRNILEVNPVRPDFNSSPLMSRIFYPAFKKGLDKIKIY